MHWQPQAPLRAFCACDRRFSVLWQKQTTYLFNKIYVLVNNLQNLSILSHILRIFCISRRLYWKAAAEPGPQDPGPRLGSAGPLFLRKLWTWKRAISSKALYCPRRTKATSMATPASQSGPKVVRRDPNKKTKSWPRDRTWSKDIRRKATGHQTIYTWTKIYANFRSAAIQRPARISIAFKSPGLYV